MTTEIRSLHTASYETNLTEYLQLIFIWLSQFVESVRTWRVSERKQFFSYFLYPQFGRNPFSFFFFLISVQNMARRFINHEYFIRITLVIYVARLKYFLIQKRGEEIHNNSNNSVQYIVIRAILNRKRQRDRKRDREGGGERKRTEKSSKSVLVGSFRKKIYGE